VAFEVVRRSPRYSLVIDIEVTDRQSENKINGQTKELSLFGCGLASFKHFVKGTSVLIRLSHRGAEVKAAARVVYANEDLGMGFAFTRMDREDERLLEWWIADSLIN
jgi:hypothetical protein